VRELAAIYYPAEPSPLLAPGLSQFSRAVHLAASDVADFLQKRTIGKLVDVSANTAIDTWNKGRKVVESERFQYLNKWYKRLLPAAGRSCASSPLSCGPAWPCSNAAVRALQPAVIDIVARRAMELDSGRLLASREITGLLQAASEEPESASS